MFYIFLFWFALFLIVYYYIGYPIILFFLGLFFKKNINSADITPSVSLLISAYNERRVIEKKIQNSLSLDYPKDKFEIIVASESNDETNNIVKKYEKDGVKLFAYEGRKGKPFTIYRTIPKCRGEIVVLTDANAMFNKEAIGKLVRHFNDPSVGCVSGDLKYTNPTRSSTGEAGRFYWGYEVFLKKLESRIYSLLGANGSIYAIRKDLYNPISEYRGEDFDIPVRIKEMGYKVILDSEAISEEEVYARTKDEFKKKVVTVSWHFVNGLILLNENIKKMNWLLVFQLLSHKFLKWLQGIILILFLFGNLFLLKEKFYLLVFIFQLIFYSLAFIGYLRDLKNKKTGTLFRIPYYFCVVNLASTVSIIKIIFNLQPAVWEKVRQD